LKLEGDLLEPVLPVLVDPDRINLVFDNLVGNAIRHSPKGSRIVVRARPEKGLVRFEVEDQGPGIPVEYQQRIFEKFFRMPEPRGRASVSGSTSRARSSPRMAVRWGGERAGKRKPVLVHPPGSAARVITAASRGDLRRELPKQRRQGNCRRQASTSVRDGAGAANGRVTRAPRGFSTAIESSGRSVIPALPRHLREGAQAGGPEVRLVACAREQTASA